MLKALEMVYQLCSIVRPIAEVSNTDNHIIAMRKFIDTAVLIVLLIGPAVVLTCVRQDTAPKHNKLALNKKTIVDKGFSQPLASNQIFIP